MQLIEFQSCRPGKLAHYVCCLVQKCLYCSCILQTMVDAAHPAVHLDTRKTAPGFIWLINGRYGSLPRLCSIAIIFPLALCIDFS